MNWGSDEFEELYCLLNAFGANIPALPVFSVIHIRYFHTIA